ncbi:MAG: NUDIX domain-containing protein [Thermoplasmata archaeon]
MADSEAPVAQECVEAYIFAGRPPRILLFRRPPARGGIWVPVSGKVEGKDRDFASALRRELEEETGFTDPKRVFPLDWEVRFDGPDGRVWRLHAYGVELPNELAPRLCDEHDAFEWVGPGEATARLHYPDNREAVQRLTDRLTEERAARRSPSPNV